jgi:eukaryotic-like serine/threonine-protein kinase
MILTELECSGRYRVVRPVADDVVATVYEAELLGAEGFSKRVALKLLRPELSGDREFLAAFVGETKRAANLMHGNIVQLYQLGEVHGEFFIATEFIKGPSVRQLIDRHRERGRPVPPPLAAYIASRVCRALDYAHMFVDGAGHRLQIIHTDVNPANVLATWDGHIKLADFGIAKARTSADPAKGKNVLMGKKHYMSPEQIMSLPVNSRSDVFSLGVVLFEMLALDWLFVEETTALAVDEVAVKPLPNIRDKVPNIDAELEQILMQALERDPIRRPTAAAMGTALDQWCAAQRELGTPDLLQAHLGRLFPASYQPPSSSGEQTSFKNLGDATRRSSKGILARLLRF